MSKYKFLLTLLFTVIAQTMMAQGKVISGTVEDAMGPIMMANVVERDANNRIVNDWESVKDEYGFTSQSDASKYVKQQLDKMTKFVRYHTQNSSLFADKYFKNFDPKTGLTDPEPAFSTFCSNALGIAQTLIVTGGNDKLNVKDASNTIVTVNASSDMANLIARDITTSEKNDGTYGRYKIIETSAFVTIHGIDTPLCFNSNRKY